MLAIKGDQALELGRRSTGAVRGWDTACGHFGDLQEWGAGQDDEPSLEGNHYGIQDGVVRAFEGTGIKAFALNGQEIWLFPANGRWCIASGDYSEFFYSERIAGWQFQYMVDTALLERQAQARREQQYALINQH